MTTTTTSTTTTTTTDPPYSTDSDLLEWRANILGLGVSSWTGYHDRARAYVNRDIEAGWYRRAVRDELNRDHREYPFAPSRLLTKSQLLDASIFKTLELAYLYLAKDRADDAFMVQSDRFKKRYNEEIARVMKAGLDYDWYADRGMDYWDRAVKPRSRRLTRG